MCLILQLFLCSTISPLVYSTFNLNVVHLEQLSRKSAQIFDDREHDQLIRVIVNSQAYFAHKNTLAIASSYLSEQIQKSNKTEIKVPYLELAHKDSFHHVLKYIYTGKLVLDNQKIDRLFDLMTISSTLNLTSLTQEVSIVLEEEGLTLENVVPIYERAIGFDQTQLRESCEYFIDENAELLFSQKSFSQLPSECLREIIGRDSFMLNEVKIFEIVKEWHVFHNRTKRLDMDLISSIRFELFRYEELLDLNSRTRLISTSDLIAILNARKAERNSIDSPKRTQLLADKQLASATADKSIKIWNVESGECMRTLAGHSASVESLQLLGNNKLASGSWDRSIKIWNLVNGRCMRTLTGHSGSIEALESLSKNLLASGSWDRSIKIWNVETGECVRTLTAHTNYVSALQLLANPTNKQQQQLASGSWDRSIKIWNFHTGEGIRTLTGHGYYVSTLKWLSGSRQLASGSWDKSIKIWNVETGKCMQTLTGHTYYVSSLQALANDQLASGSWDHSIKIWNVQTGVCLRTLTGHLSTVSSLQLLANNKLASGSWEKAIKIWNVETGQCIQTLTDQSIHVNSLQLLANL